MFQVVFPLLALYWVAYHCIRGIHQDHQLECSLWIQPPSIGERGKRLDHNKTTRRCCISGIERDSRRTTRTLIRCLESSLCDHSQGNRIPCGTYLKRAHTSHRTQSRGWPPWLSSLQDLRHAFLCCSFLAWSLF